jgi:hypothetical protein
VALVASPDFLSDLVTLSQVKHPKQRHKAFNLILSLPTRALVAAYMRRRESRGFFVIKHFFLPSFLPSFSRGSRERKSALMARTAPLLGRDERSTPRSPEGRAGRREGLTAKARAKLQWCRAITPQM